MGAATQTLLTNVKPCLTHRLVHLSKLSLTHEFKYLLWFKDTASLFSHERHEMRQMYMKYINCEDHASLDFISAVLIYDLFHLFTFVTFHLFHGNI